MSEKVKSWWSDDGKWFCLLVNDGINQATVSLTPEEASNLTRASAVGAGAREALDREAIGRVLYECEKRRGVHADAVVKGAFPKASDALLMEPWDECKDTFLSDADAIIAALQSEPVQPAGRGERVLQGKRLADARSLLEECGYNSYEVHPECYRNFSYVKLFELLDPARPEAPAGVRYWEMMYTDLLKRCHDNGFFPALPSDPVRQTTQPIQRDSTARLDSGEVRGDR